MSGRAVEAAGDVNTLLLDKTGTITLGNRQASEFVPRPGVTEQRSPTPRSSRRLTRRRGRSIVVFAKEEKHRRPRPQANQRRRALEFTAQTRMSGVEPGGTRPADPARARFGRDYGRARRRHGPPIRQQIATTVSGAPAAPLVVGRELQTGCPGAGVIQLSDVVKQGGIRERFDEMRKMGIRTVMITGDNPLTAGDCRRGRRRRLPGEATPEQTSSR